jgi:hypothetical protein
VELRLLIAVAAQLADEAPDWHVDARTLERESHDDGQE